MSTPGFETRRDLETILILGSGPIVIGQACEFDYSGTQACRALRAVGYRVVLVNSNPATIMTDAPMADRTYLEPVTADVVERVIAIEKPDALLPTMGGQTALNVAVELAVSGALERHGVEMIGASLETIRRAESREVFRDCMLAAGLKLPDSRAVRTVEDGVRFARQVGLPVIVRASFALGGAGSGAAHDEADLRRRLELCLQASATHEALVEQSLLGHLEFELEMMRDRADNAVVVCSIENLDPMGVHTGDSVTVAPQQTLGDREYQGMRDDALKVMRAVGVETGGSNIQFAVDPRTRERYVIEMNPRVSRSSALASKATGFPIAKIAAWLAVGATLDQIPNDITRRTPASFEPALDYVAVKIPRWAFEKFPAAEPVLGTQMKSVGEVMGLGRSFQEAFLKALRSLESPSQGWRGEYGAGPLGPEELGRARPGRWLAMRQALREGRSPAELARWTHVHPWFLEQFRQMVELEEEVRAAGTGFVTDLPLLERAKRRGFGDADLAAFSGSPEAGVRAAREAAGLVPAMKAVDTCAAEFEAETPYFYSTYGEQDESRAGAGRTILVLGSGPNRIGQGLEFDYCCVQACLELREAGYQVVMINSNPETVSTDYDVSDRLYFEPLTLENVLAVVATERPIGVLVQLGGQTPLSLARGLAEAGVNILGTGWDAIDRAENRLRFSELVRELGLRQPVCTTAWNADDAVAAAEGMGWPILARPSYVLGGRGMRILFGPDDLAALLKEVAISREEPLLLDRFLEDAIELEVDAVCDGERVWLGAIMEHLEAAGIHSGDSSCVIPAFSVGRETLAEIAAQTTKLALALPVVGLMNVQFALRNDTLYVLEANPRASRTVPFVSKAAGWPLARVAARVMAGGKLPSDRPPVEGDPQHVSLKHPALPFDRFPGVDTLLGPEMKSTGEVMGISDNMGLAYAKAKLALGERLPLKGRAFLSVCDQDKRAIVFMAKQLRHLGFELLATGGTALMLRRNGIPARPVFKVHEGGPNAEDLITRGEVDLVINTPLGRESQFDEVRIRRAALQCRVPCLTTLAAASAAIHAIEALQRGDFPVYALQDLHPGGGGS
ncbi:MAG: carbamoyl-phosphate synthase large subunit [Candidatus Eisenbacteria bacterium]|nr:carbamoyl-phosphate synthase large subunit [Candidatus Eisenbacteria bacterium]